jgi:hypothetical protein
MLTENPYLRQGASTLFFPFCGLDNGVNLSVSITVGTRVKNLGE